MRKYLKLSIIVGSIALSVAALIFAFLLMAKPPLDEYLLAAKNSTAILIYIIGMAYFLVCVGKPRGAAALSLKVVYMTTFTILFICTGGVPRISFILILAASYSIIALTIVFFQRKVF